MSLSVLFLLCWIAYLVFLLGSLLITRDPLSVVTLAKVALRFPIAQMGSRSTDL